MSAVLGKKVITPYQKMYYILSDIKYTVLIS